MKYNTLSDLRVEYKSASRGGVVTYKIATDKASYWVSYSWVHRWLERCKVCLAKFREQPGEGFYLSLMICNCIIDCPIGALDRMDVTWGRNHELGFVSHWH